MTTIHHDSHPKGLPAPYEYAEHLEKHHPEPEHKQASGVVALIVCTFIGGLMGCLFALFF